MAVWQFKFSQFYGNIKIYAQNNTYSYQEVVNQITFWLRSKKSSAQLLINVEVPARLVGELKLALWSVSEAFILTMQQIFIVLIHCHMHYLDPSDYPCIALSHAQVQ